MNREAEALNKEITPRDQVVEDTRQSELTGNESAPKKPFIEPTVSVPTDVLEATSFFQAPTIEAAST